MQYEFGFGLSYTTFEMADVSVSQIGSGGLSATPPDQPIQPGGNPTLWATVYEVVATISNTGPVAGFAVPQLYLGLPAPSADAADITPLKALRGFERVLLQPGESREVRFPLQRRDLSYWDVVSQQWVVAGGKVSVYAGFSSRDVRATAAFEPLVG